ncbi:MAG: hypothetical protein LC798_05260 [Chloroflexi bacterium]|nr:hypothetical protein [Chloroflexota bacterium]
MNTEAPGLPGPADMLASLGLPTPEDTAREAAEMAAWRAEMAAAAGTHTELLRSILGALVGLRADVSELHTELGDLAERLPTMPRIFRQP